MKKSKGFTLIELLVVITIIALLAIAIMIAYNRARAAGKDSKRREVCHQIATAEELYYQTNSKYTGTVSGNVNGSLYDEYIKQNLSVTAAPIAPVYDNDGATWNSVTSLTNGGQGFAVHAKLESRKDTNQDEWFCCNENGCQEASNYNACRN